MAPVQTPVNFVLYSFDQGATPFKQLPFSNTPIFVYSIWTEPGGTGQKFVINGQDKFGQWYIYGIDLSDSPLPNCVDSNYEQFTPSNGDEKFCFMGAVTDYQRRQQNASCYNNNPNSDTITSQTQCKCDWTDYECDYNYQGSWRNSTDGFNCTKLYEPTDPCADGSDYYWQQTTGYVLVPETLCIYDYPGALNLVPKQVSCPKKKSNSAEVAAGVIVTLTIVGSIIGVVVLYFKNEKFRTWVQSLKPSSSSQQRYTSVTQHEEED